MAKAKSEVAVRGAASLPVNYAEIERQELAEIQKQIGAATGDRVRMKNNQAFITPDGQEGDELEVAIVDFVSANLFYDRPFDPKSPVPPACFALGAKPTDLAPSENSPSKQADLCAECPNNAWGSDLKGGKGKACKNTRLVAMTTVNVLPDGATPPLLILSIPPTALKAFDGYIRTVADRLKTTPRGVLTRITLDKNVDYASPKFEVVRKLEPGEVAGVRERMEEARNRLMSEPDVSGYEPPKAVGRPRPAGKR